MLKLTLLFALAAVLLVACSGDDDGDDDSRSADPDATPSADGEFEFGEFEVESLEILQLESFPVQIVVQANGAFPDGCTEVDDVQTEQAGNEFIITITTRRPAEGSCTEALVEHSEGINLGSPEPGDYTVTVNEVSEEFTVSDAGAEDGDLPDGSSDETQAPQGSDSVEGICAAPAGDPDQPVSSDDPPPCDDTVDETDYTFGSFEVESVDVLLAESFPVQVFVQAAGNFPDGCTEIHNVTVEQEGNDFVVTIITRRFKDAVCTQALVPHSEGVPLGSPDPGDYTVTVNGVSESFTVPG